MLEAHYQPNPAHTGGALAPLPADPKGTRMTTQSLTPEGLLMAMTNAERLPSIP
jgi:hypothetical protein